MSNAVESSTVATTPPQNPTAKRKPALMGLTLLVLLAAGGYAAYRHWHASRVEATDNAYVQGHVVQITPQVGGTVQAVHVQDTDDVKAGQPLLQLDPADAQLALDQAGAQLGQTVREVRALYANNTTLAAAVAVRQADLARANAEVARTQDDFARRQPLVASGAVSAEDLDHAKTSAAAARGVLASAQAAVVAAQEALAANQALTDGVGIEQHPNVQRAAARAREAYLALKRTALVAPVSGQVAKRNVQLGQRVAAGAPLMSVIALDSLWVDANFKEVQLRDMRIGQPATLVADVYGNKVVYHGTVAGLSAGTGAAFALLPAQNATGNWIKVVQRVPVRIALNEKELRDHPLRVGLSMEVEVDVSHTQGDAVSARKASNPSAVAPALETDEGSPLDLAAREWVQHVIAQHVGRKVAPVAKASSKPSGTITAQGT